MPNISGPDVLFLIMVGILLVGIFILVPIAALRGQAKRMHREQTGKNPSTTLENVDITAKAVWRFLILVILLVVGLGVVIAGVHLMAAAFGLLLPAIGGIGIAFLLVRFLVKLVP